MECLAPVWEDGLASLQHWALRSSLCNSQLLLLFAFFTSNRIKVTKATNATKGCKRSSELDVLQNVKQIIRAIFWGQRTQWPILYLRKMEGPVRSTHEQRTIVCSCPNAKQLHQLCSRCSRWQSTSQNQETMKHYFCVIYNI